MKHCFSRQGADYSPWNCRLSDEVAQYAPYSLQPNALQVCSGPPLQPLSTVATRRGPTDKFPCTMYMILVLCILAAGQACISFFSMG